jgi:hypothetical protein
MLLACAALTQSACQCSRRDSHRQEVTAEKRQPQQGTSKPVASAVSLEDALRGSFTPVMSAQELDSTVREELGSRIEEPMAAAGEPYQSTDVVFDHLPWRRFVVAGVSTLSPKLWLLCYEHGGIGHHHHLILFELENGAASVRKAGQWLPGRAEPVTLQRAVEALRKDEQRLDNHW